MGTDNVLYPGQYNEGVVILKRDMKRNCDVHIKINLQTNGRVWDGSVFDQEFSFAEVQWAEQTTPGQFIFPINVKASTPPGSAILGASADFKCMDNPFHRYTNASATLKQLIPVTIAP